MQKSLLVQKTDRFIKTKKLRLIRFLQIGDKTRSSESSRAAKNREQSHKNLNHHFPSVIFRNHIGTNRSKKEQTEAQIE